MTARENHGTPWDITWRRWRENLVNGTPFVDLNLSFYGTYDDVAVLLSSLLLEESTINVTFKRTIYSSREKV